jgi:hypothetical protein
LFAGRRIPERFNILGQHRGKPGIGELFRVEFPASALALLLPPHPIMVVSKFVHEHVEQQKRFGLRQREMASDTAFLDRSRNTDRAQHMGMGVVIIGVPQGPEIPLPSADGDQGRFFHMEVAVVAIPGFVEISTRQKDSLNTNRQIRPIRNQGDKPMDVSLGHSVPEPFPGRFPINDVSKRGGRAMTVLSLHPAVPHFWRGPTIEAGEVHGGES